MCSTCGSSGWSSPGCGAKPTWCATSTTSCCVSNADFMTTCPALQVFQSRLGLGSGRLRNAGFVHLTPNGRTLELQIDAQAKQDAELLDGCYCIESEAVALFHQPHQALQLVLAAMTLLVLGRRITTQNQALVLVTDFHHVLIEEIGLKDVLLDEFANLRVGECRNVLEMRLVQALLALGRSCPDRPLEPPLSRGSAR